MRQWAYNTLESRVSLLQVEEAKMDKKIQKLTLEQVEMKIKLKLYDLCFMFNYYKTVPVVKSKTSYSSYSDFANAYSDLKAQVDDKEIPKEELDEFVAIVNGELNGIDIRSILESCRSRNDIAHTDIRSKTSQQTFLNECNTINFGTSQDLASRMIRELKKTALKRIC